MASESLEQSFEINPSPPPQPKSIWGHIKGQWKLILFLLVSLAITIMLNVYKPAKLFLLNLSQEIHTLGWYGPLILSLINGCIAIPFGLPYIVFEMMNVLLNDNFFVALGSSILSKIIGCSIVYYIIRFHLREKILRRLKKTKFYRGVEIMLQKNPLKFSVMVRVTVLPFSIKNYSLAVPECINYRIYLIATLIETIPKSSIDIYLLQRAARLGALVTSSTTTEKVITVVMVVVSLLCLLYIAYYTKQILKDIDSEVEALHVTSNPKKEKDDSNA